MFIMPSCQTALLWVAALYMYMYASLLVVCALPSQDQAAPPTPTTLKVATYNIWNIMFNWDVRKHHIADMIRKADIDLVAFQEVRADRSEKQTQLLDLKELLPAYRWQVFHAMQKVIPHKGAQDSWPMEGLGILSRHPITSTVPQSLSHQSPKDKNQRTVLHVSLCLHAGVNVSLAVVHLSYDKWQQCVNVAEIMKYVRGSRPVNSIIVGDFNTYADYPWPIEGLLYGYFSTINKCPKYAAQKNPTSEGDLMTYTDAWAEANPNKNGYTFSNMPQPGFQSRPDRVLFASKSWSVFSCEALGLGEEYAKRFSLRILLTRLAAVLRASEDAFYLTPSPRGCLHDCGPHGSCRCGICTSGGDKNRCETGSCPECATAVYRMYLIWKVLVCFLMLQVTVSTVLIVQQCGPRRLRALSPASLLACLLGNCHSMPFISKLTLSRHRGVQMLRILCPVLNVRPACQLFICCVGFALLIAWTLHVFDDQLRIIYAILPEELNPSDHLMVVASAKIKN